MTEQLRPATGHAADAAAADEVAATVVESIRAILPALPPEQIGLHQHLRDLGADSVDRVEIIMLIISRLGLEEPMSSFSDLPNVRALIDFVHGLRRS